MGMANMTACAIRIWNCYFNAHYFNNWTISVSPYLVGRYVMTTAPLVKSPVNKATLLVWRAPEHEATVRHLLRGKVVRLNAVAAALQVNKLNKWLSQLTISTKNFAPQKRSIVSLCSLIPLRSKNRNYYYVQIRMLQWAFHSINSKRKISSW